MERNIRVAVIGAGDPDADCAGLSIVGYAQYRSLNVITATGGPLTHVRGSAAEWIYRAATVREWGRAKLE